jgi:hypothetical protein
VDELVARFAAQAETSTRRRAARSMKALAGLDLTLTPPPVAVVSRPLHGGPAAPSHAGDAAAPGSLGAAASDPPEPSGSAPPSSPRRRLRSLWLTVVTLALVCAALASALRPGLLASLAPPLARAAQQSSANPGAAALPADD